MDQFTFMVNQLSIGCQSRATPEAQGIAQRIVEQYLLNGYEINRGIVHKAVDQTTVDYAAI